MNKQTLVINAITEYLETVANVGGEVYTQQCSCGAIEMGTYSGLESIFFLESNAPFIKPTNTMEMCNCNHCINDWGVDIDLEEEEEEEE